MLKKMLTEARALVRSYREPSVPQDNQSSSSFPINATLSSLNAGRIFSLIDFRTKENRDVLKIKEKLPIYIYAL